MATFAEIIMKIAEKYPELKQEEVPAPVAVYYCRQCSDFAEVEAPDAVCPACGRETERGYQALVKTGRCANGAERDHGTVNHAVRFDSHAAVCGTKPGRRSSWSTPYKSREITCQRCAAKLEREG